jgi:NRPS condensation-like uncharacterized protein
MSGEGRTGLTPIQQGMVFHQLMHPQDGVDVEQITIELREAVDAGLLEQAWRQVIAAHPVLRSRVVDVDGDYRLDPVAEFRPSIDEIAADVMLEEWLAQDRFRGFDLFTEVPLRLAIQKSGPGRAVLVWTFHHILLDGRSFPDVLSDVFDAYDALRQGQAVDVPPRPAMTAFLDWLAQQDTASGLAYWRGLLSGIGPQAALLPTKWQTKANPWQGAS